MSGVLTTPVALEWLCDPLPVGLWPALTACPVLEPEAAWNQTPVWARKAVELLGSLNPRVGLLAQPASNRYQFLSSQLKAGKNTNDYLFFLQRALIFLLPFMDVIKLFVNTGSNFCSDPCISFWTWICAEPKSFLITFALSRET